MTTAPQKYPEQETDDNKHIDVSDILHLVREANEKGYVKTSNKFEKPKAEFKKRTLKDLAESNMIALQEKETLDTKTPSPAEMPASQDEQPEASLDQAVEETPDNNGENPVDQPDQQTADQIDDEPLDISASETDQQVQSDDNPAEHDPVISPEQNAEQKQDDIASDMTDTSTATVPASGTEGFKTTLTPASQETSSPADTAEYDRGYTEGKAAALLEMDENMTAAITSFTAAAESITREDSIDLAQLEKAMFGAINQLASERAGIEIDSNPAPFTAKVASMVSRIRNRIDEPVIHLHPDDIATIQPQLEKQLAPRKITLTADEMMKRGDARVDVGSIGVMDLIDDQPGKVASTSKKAKVKSDIPAKADPETENNDHE